MVIDLDLGEDVSLDSIDATLFDEIENTSSIYDMTIIAYLDNIGVPETTLQNLISHRDAFSMDSLSSSSIAGVWPCSILYSN